MSVASNMLDSCLLTFFHALILKWDPFSAVNNFQSATISSLDG